MVTASFDGSARVWDAARGESVAVLTHLREPFYAVFGPDSQRVLTAARDNRVRVWDTDTGQELFARDHSREATVPGAFRPDGKWVVIAGDRSARVWEVDTGQELATLEGHADGITSVAFGPDGTRVLTTAKDQTARVWRLSPPQPRAVGFSLLGDRVVFTDAAGVRRALATPKLETANDPPPAAQPHALRTNPDKLRELIVTPDGTATLRDTATGVDVFTLPQADVADASFSPDGHWIATVHKDGSVRLWDGRPEDAAKKP